MLNKMFEKKYIGIRKLSPNNRLIVNKLHNIIEAPVVHEIPFTNL